MKRKYFVKYSVPLVGVSSLLYTTSCLLDHSIINSTLLKMGISCNTIIVSNRRI
ncbi:hypothetical protein ACTFJW_08955 [Clostridium cagae]|uniref:hypothetical protein n=1 Tax=Clostridium cagae TaxID=2080751 RepID=UPI003F767949